MEGFLKLCGVIFILGIIGAALSDDERPSTDSGVSTVAIDREIERRLRDRDDIKVAAMRAELARFIRELKLEASADRDAIVSAVREHARRAEAKLGTEVDLSGPASERGIGGVLTVGRVPRKVLVAREHLPIYRDDSVAFQARSHVPYFVFDDDGQWLQIGHYQDREVALGWVDRDQCFPWFSRRLAYPKPGRHVAALNKTVGSLDPTNTMPWPILYANDDDDGFTVLAVDDEGAPLPFPLRAEDADFYVLFSQAEIDRSLSDLTGLIAVLQSGRMPVRDTAAKLGSFMTQAQTDFLDLSEVQAVLDIFPGGSAAAGDPLFRAELSDRFDRIIASLDKQIDWLSKLGASTAYYNAERGFYVVPIDQLHAHH